LMMPLFPAMRPNLTRWLAPGMTLVRAAPLVRAAQVAKRPCQGPAVQLKRWEFQLRLARVTAVPGDS
jgi:hypothetical protein